MSRVKVYHFQVSMVPLGKSEAMVFPFSNSKGSATFAYNMQKSGARDIRFEKFDENLSTWITDTEAEKLYQAKFKDILLPDLRASQAMSKLSDEMALYARRAHKKGVLPETKHSVLSAIVSLLDEMEWKIDFLQKLQENELPDLNVPENSDFPIVFEEGQEQEAANEIQEEILEPALPEKKREETEGKVKERSGFFNW